MFVATAIVTVLLAALMIFAALRKLTRAADVVQSYARAGVPEDKLAYLAVILIAGATGLILGLWWTPLGVAAAIGTVCYFLVAIVFHLRNGDAEHVATPIVMCALGIASLVLLVLGFT